MREIRPSGSEGGVALTTLSLPPIITSFGENSSGFTMTFCQKYFFGFIRLYQA